MAGGCTRCDIGMVSGQAWLCGPDTHRCEIARASVIVQMVGNTACTPLGRETAPGICTHLGGLGGGGVRLTSWGLTQSSPLHQAK